MNYRNRKQLEEGIVKARSKKEKALAYYNLGLFHDNNAREAEAISNYLNALELGLDSETKAEALAWLASSFYKTGKSVKGLKRCIESKKITKDKKLAKFLIGLEKRIRVSLKIRKKV